MFKRLVLALLIVLALPAPSFAQEDPLTKCLADNTTGKQRKDLARWIFVSMAAHPEMRDLASPSGEAVDAVSKEMAGVVMHLFTETCTAEIRAVGKNDGPQALRRAFEYLGKLAMMELISNPDVTGSMSKFERYIDRSKVNAALEGR